MHHGNHDHDYSKPINIADIQCQPCRDLYYNKYVHLSEIDEVSLNAQEQNSSLWFDSRKVRIPASVVNKVTKTKQINKICLLQIIYIQGLKATMQHNMEKYQNK